MASLIGVWPGQPPTYNLIESTEYNSDLHFVFSLPRDVTLGQRFGATSLNSTAKCDESLPLFLIFVMIAYKMHHEVGNVQITLANIRLSSQVSDFLILILFFSFALLHPASFHTQSPHKNEWWLTQVSYYYLVTKAAISDNCKLVKIIFS